MPPGSSTTRVGNTPSSSSVGPAYMSMTPVSSSASIEKKNSPRPFTTLALPSSYFSPRANSVAHFGRFSISDRYEKTSPLGAGSTAVTVRVFIGTSLGLVLYRTISPDEQPRRIHDQYAREIPPD